MAFLDVSLKVVRLLSAVMWLAVGGVTLWGAWMTFRHPERVLGPLVEGLQQTAARNVESVLPSGLPPDVLQRLRTGIPRAPQ